MQATGLDDEQLSGDGYENARDTQIMAVDVEATATSTVENNYFTSSSCVNMKVQNTVNASHCSPVTAYTNFGRYFDYSVIIYCNEDGNAWKMSMYSPGSNCRGNAFDRNLTGSGTECSHFNQGTEYTYFEVVCHSTQSPTLMPTAVPSIAPYPSNYDGLLTIYNGYDCPADDVGEYLAMPMNDFKCVSTFIDGAPVNIDMICDIDGLYPLSLNLYDPSYPGCPKSALQSTMGFISQYECATSGQYYYNHTLLPFSVVAACGKNLIEHKCETVYNGVLLQSYSLIFFNAVLFSLLKLLFEEYFMPALFALLSVCFCGLISPPLAQAQPPARAAASAPQTSTVSNPMAKKAATASQEPAEAVEMGAVGKSKAAESASAPSNSTNGDAAATTEKPGASLFSNLFLVFQGINAFIAFVFAFLLRDTTRTGWHQYQNFYGFLLNSSFMTFAISLFLRLFRDQDSAESKIVAFQALSILVVVPILLPPFITHFIPGVIVYIWVVIIAASAVYVFYAVLQGVGTVLQLSSNPKYELFSKETAIRVGMIFFFQTFYTYMVFYYAYAASDTHDNQAISGEHYLCGVA